MEISSSSSKQLTRWQWIALFAGIASLIVVTLVLPLIAQQRRKATYYPVSEARSEAPEMLEKIGAPPGAKGAAFRTVDEGPSAKTFTNAGKVWLSWSHLHDTPQTFQEVLAWYTPRLTASGWRMHGSTPSTGTAFCQAPWLLEINPAASEANAEGGLRRFELRLEWNNQFKAGSCRHP